MTYLLDGKQYIAFMGGIGVPPGPGAVAPPFALPPVEPTAAAAAQQGQAPPAPTGPPPVRPRLYVYMVDAVKLK
jgi:hypothetical protein